MPTQVTTAAETQIRQLIDGWVSAVRRKDANAIVADYARDTLFFDAVPPLQYKGIDAYRKNWQECFEMMQGPVDFEMRELDVSAGDEVAYAHSVNRLSGIEKKNGKKMEMWFRATVCFRKAGGKWQVTHEHASVPFYPDENKAATDLKP